MRFGELLPCGRRIQTQLLELDRQQGQALIDVVMELPGETASFLFLRFDETPADRSDRMCGTLLSVMSRQDPTNPVNEPALVVHRTSHIEQPPIVAVGTSQPEFRPERPPMDECVVVRALVAAPVILVNALRPALSQLGLQRAGR